MDAIQEKREVFGLCELVFDFEELGHKRGEFGFLESIRKSLEKSIIEREYNQEVKLSKI